MKDMKKKMTSFERFRERHERLDNLCDWLEHHWEDVALYGLSTIIIVLLVLFVLIILYACADNQYMTI